MNKRLEPRLAISRHGTKHPEDLVLLPSHRFMVVTMNERWHLPPQFVTPNCGALNI
jgi:hypothetical protein